MSKCGNKNCGCNDGPFHAPPPCTQGTSYCPNPEPCAETFSADCIIWMGDDIPTFGIKRGDRLTSILQRLIHLTDLDCPLVDGYNPVFLRSTNIWNTSIEIKWDAVIPTITSYQVEYQLVGAMSWTILAVTGLPLYPSALISGLTPNTAYDIRVGTLHGATTCYSATIRVTTLNS